jgi:hypothetical protein
MAMLPNPLSTGTITSDGTYSPATTDTWYTNPTPAPIAEVESQNIKRGATQRPLTIYPAANGYVVCPEGHLSGNSGLLMSGLSIADLFVFTDINDAVNYIVMEWSGLVDAAKPQTDECETAESA